MTQYGGQALIEGVMMRSPRYVSVACRAPNGQVLVRTEALEKTWIGKQKWLKLPFLRGSFAILDAMTLGSKAMRFCAEVQADPQYAEKGSKEAEGGPLTDKQKTVQTVAIGATVVIGLVLGQFIFDAIPQFVAEVTGKAMNLQKKGIVLNYIAEVIKVIIFLGYLKLISQMEAIKDVFKYHGAEHKAINAMELDDEVTIETSAKASRLHPRCGTSFMVIVLMLGILLLPLIPRYLFNGGHPTNVVFDALARTLVVLCALPIISGIAYELLKIAGKFRNEKWVSYAFAPGIWSQKYLTTIEPEERHLKVAVAALNSCIEAESSGSPKVTDDYYGVVEDVLT